MRDRVNTPRALRWTSAAALLCAAVSLAVSAQTAPLMLVSTAWPPFTNAPGHPRFALDLVEAALGRVGQTATTTIVSAAEFTPALLGGRFDGTAALWKDADREQALIFSQPYLENRLILIGRRGADVSAGALVDLRGRRVAVVEGYAYGDSIDRSGLVLVRSSGEEDSLARLLKAEVDYTLMDELVVQYIMANYPKESAARLQIGNTPLLSRELYFGVRRAHPDAHGIVNRFNAQLSGMIADRTYHRLLHLKWIRADVNGDGIADYVPMDDRPGPEPPRGAYSLFSKTVPLSEKSGKPGFYLGGNLYSDWANVPDRYKMLNSQEADARRSTASIFTFRW